MIQVLHNNRCSKSRNTIAFLEEANEEFEIRYYLENALSEAELQYLLVKLRNVKPDFDFMEMVRTNEAVWKEKFKGKTYSEKEILIIISEFPVLLERPIIIKDDKAVIGRPTENIELL